MEIFDKNRKQKELIIPQKTVSGRRVGWDTRRTVDKRLRRNYSLVFNNNITHIKLGNQRYTVHYTGTFFETIKYE